MLENDELCIFYLLQNDFFFRIDSYQAAFRMKFESTKNI